MKNIKNSLSFSLSFTAAILILACSLLITNNINATNYYVSATGSDAADGLTITTPWQSISKINTSFSSFPVGSTIYFNRGDTFYGTLTTGKSGTSGNPITISAYGTGAKPVITGFTTITGWTNEGGGIYSKVITSEAQTNMVTINGKQVGMGRYPDTGYLTYSSFNTNISISDFGLMGSSTNWTGAEIAIRKNNWTLDRCLVTNHTGTVLTYTSYGSTQTPVAGFGYFILNDLKTLTTYGEWYHNKTSGKFYMYFGAIDPNTKVVQVATLNNLVYNGGNPYITVDNLNVTGAINAAVFLQYYANYCIVQNCDISFSGSLGIEFGPGGAGGNNCIADNNSIRDCNSQGMHASGTSPTITNNTISNIGLIPGQSISLGVNAIYMLNGGLISYNTIKQIGYDGIYLGHSGAAATVSYNRIDSVCLVLNDGGAIYMTSVNAGARTLDHNIITNSIGNVDGTPGYGSSAEGIYLDEYSTNVVVTNNTVAYCGYSGIKLHKAHEITITDNTTYNCFSGIYFQNSTGTNIRNVSLLRNIFFAKMAIQFTSEFNTVANDITLFGTADNNFYARPMDDNATLRLYQPSLGAKLTKTLAQWQTFSGQDVNSKKSPISITDVNDIRFEFNATKSPSTIPLVGKYITADSKVYDGSITLQPYTSAVLVKYNPTVVTQVNDPKIIKVIPSLVSNQITIEIEGDTNSHGFQILNSIGQIIFSGKMAGKTVVESSKFSPGMYFVRIEIGSSFEVKKIMKI